MEKETIETNLKRRSYRACVADAYRSTRDNLWKMTKKYWKLIAVAVVVQGALSSWMSSLSMGITYVGFEFKGVQFMLCAALTTIATFVEFAAMYFLANGKSMLWNIKRMLRLVPLSLLATLIYLILAAGASFVYVMLDKDPANIPLTRLLTIALLVLPVFSIFYLPLSFAFNRYMFEPESKLLKTLKPSYAAGFRSWGFIFITLFLSALCAFIYLFIFSIPTSVLAGVRSVAAVSSIMNGDPVGLPSYLWVFDFIGGVWGNLVTIYAWAFSVYVLRNIYETVKCKMNDREAARLEAESSMP